MYQYKLIVCFDNRTWTDCVYIYSERDNLTREEAEQMYLTENAEKMRLINKELTFPVSTDISYVGILCIEVEE